ncbi:MAG: methyltransferase [Myxococcota bacterium]
MTPKPPRSELPPTPLHGTAVEERFAALSAFIAHHRHLWAPRPFVHRTLAWEEDFPQVAAWLRRQSTERICAMEADPWSRLAEADDVPHMLRRWARHRTTGVTLGVVATGSIAGLEHHRVRFRVPGRKWGQVKAFIGAVAAAWPAQGGRVVEWCAGHGHLGRTLAHHAGVSAVLLEREINRAKQAQALIARLGVEARFVPADVLQPGSWSHLGPDVVAVGLHACGVLNATLLRQGCARQAPLMAVAPCCPHVGVPAGEDFVPLSAVGRATGIRLNPSALRLSIADEVVATPKQRARRSHEQAWRLGLDLLVREATGDDRYRSLGVLPTGALRVANFATFCRQQSHRLGLPLPPRWDPEHAEQAGWERARVARGLGVVRSLFRRPLEVWLALDRALMLHEAGRQVEVGLFCSAQQTPRNILILSRSS